MIRDKGKGIEESFKDISAVLEGVGQVPNQNGPLIRSRNQDDTCALRG